MEYWGKPLLTLFSVAATVRLRLWFGTTLKRARSCVGGATTNRSRHGLPDIEHAYLGE